MSERAFRISPTMVAAAALASCSPAPESEPGRRGGTLQAEARTEIWFEDVTAWSGLDFTHRHGGSGQRYMVETMGSGGGLVDLDGDTDLDVVLLQGDPLPGHDGEGPWRDSVWRNDGTGRFEDVTAEVMGAEPGYSMGMCAGDVDEDGDTDLVITRFGSDRLLLNEDGRLVDRTAGSGLRNPAWGTSCALADYDRDGCLDVAIVNYVDFTLDTHKVCDAGGAPGYCHPDAYGGVPDRLFAGNCDGTFSDRSEASGIAVADPDESKGLGLIWTDFDDDGWLDLYVSNDSTRNFLWRNLRDGTFEDVGVSVGVAFNEEGVTEAGMGVDAGDVDRDGRIDLVVTNLDLETNSLYLQFANGIFEDATRAYGLSSPSHERVGFGVELFDADLDGHLDLYIANGHILDTARTVRPTASFAQPDQLFDGDGRRFTVVAQAGPWFSEARVNRSVSAGDVDGDGDEDLLVTACNQPATLLFNRVADGRKAVVLDLRLASGRPAVGARATLVDDRGTRQIDEVRAGSSYLSQRGTRLFFGLADGARVERLEVRWPDGTEEVIAGERVPTDRQRVLRLEYEG